MAIPNPPTGLTPNQTQWLPTQGAKVNVTLSWQPSAGATGYSVRVEDKTVPSLRDARNNCPGDKHFVCINDMPQTSVAVTARAGHAYDWWVHAVNASGTSAAATASFRIDEPPLNPSFTHGPMEVFILSPAYREVIRPTPPAWLIEVFFRRTPQQVGQTFILHAHVHDRHNALIASGSIQWPAGLYKQLSFNVPPLAAGRYELRVVLRDPANAVVEAEAFELEVHADDPVTQIDSRARVRRDSIPWFPFGFYIAEQMADEDFARMASWGATAALSYGYGWLYYGAPDPQTGYNSARDFIARAHRSGMGIIYNFAAFARQSPHFPFPSQLSGLDLAVEYMSNFRTHPALLAWYVADEPNLAGKVDRMPQLLAMHQLIADYDPDHPTMLVLLAGDKGNIDFWNNATDITAVDPYPIPGYPLETVSQWTEGNGASARGVRPFWTVTQIHSAGNYAQFPIDASEPTAEEKVSMTMLALIAGATGVILYSYFDLFREVVRLPDGSYVRQPSSPETLNRRFAEVATIGRHVRSVIPSLLSGTVRTLTPRAATALRYRAMEMGGDMWVILANPTPAAITTSFTLPAGSWAFAHAPNERAGAEQVTTRLLDATTLEATVVARGGGTVHVERAGVLGSGWNALPDSARDIGVGPDGSVWIVGTTAVAGGFPIRHFNGTGWTTVPGGATRIAVGPTGPWIVNNAGVIYRRQGTTFTPLPGTATDIAVGPDGEAWMISNSAAAAGFFVYRWTGSEWRQIDGAGVRIAVGPDGVPWMTDSANRILRHNGVRWDVLPGAAVDIGVGADGAPWVIGVDPTPGGTGIYRWNGVGFQRADGGAVAVSVAPDGLPWVINAAGAIHRRVR